MLDAVIVAPAGAFPARIERISATAAVGDASASGICAGSASQIVGGRIMVHGALGIAWCGVVIRADDTGRFEAAGLGWHLGNATLTEQRYCDTGMTWEDWQGDYASKFWRNDGIWATTWGQRAGTSAAVGEMGGGLRRYPHAMTKAVFDRTINHTNAKLRVQGLDVNGAGTSYTEYTTSGTGTVYTFPSGYDRILLCRIVTTTTSTPSKDDVWVRMSSLKVYKLSNATVSTIVADMLAAKPSQHMASFVDEGVADSVEPYVWQGGTLADALADVLKYADATLMHEPMQNAPALRLRKWPSTAEYLVLLDESESVSERAVELDGMANRAVVRRTSGGVAYQEVVTASSPVLDALGWTQTVALDVGEASQSTAQTVGQAALKAAAERLSLEVKTRSVYDTANGRLVPPEHVRPGRVVQIVGGAMNVNARLIEVESDGASVRLVLSDTASRRLDVMLARLSLHRR